ncbi:MAG TPA: carboxypeptidase-like regulatory domain-containing protein [Candidatus Ozemobacteraceae bacterium]|nr:carboxypeptidase-like regulatory domain-containing protein [Candidatus Ozemobacteraceae bacterium]
MARPDAAGAAANPDLAASVSTDGYVRDQLVLVFSDGPVYFNHADQAGWKRTAQRQIFIDGDGIRTGPHGYAVISWSTDNLLLIKPDSGVRFTLKPAGSTPRLSVRVHAAALLVAARESQSVEIEGRHGNLWVTNGEATYLSNETRDQLRAVRGKAEYRPTGAAEPTGVPEGYGLDVDQHGQISALTAYDMRREYDDWRRFNTWLRNFDTLHQKLSTEIAYRIDTVQINNRFVGTMETDQDGYRIIDPGAEAAPRTLHVKLKLTPYPRPADRFELYINKDLVYALREGRDGFFEVKIPTPTFPELFATIHYIDSLGRRDRIFHERFVIYNRHRKIDEIRVFLQQLSMAMARRDNIFLRDHISREYRDWFGNSWFDFVKMFDDSLRDYRDIRLILHPHTFKFKGEQVLVNMNYRLSALTGNWSWRYEDAGSELMTLSFENGEWRIRSKAKGLFFQRMKVAVDLRLGILRGRVTDERSGSPIVGATVKIRQRGFKTLTDSMGEYIIYNIPAGTYDMEISKNGYGTLTATRVEVAPTGQRY